MNRILLWGLGVGYNVNINSIKYQELLGNIRVVGVTDTNNIYPCLDGYPFIAVEEIEDLKVDYIVITAEKYFDEIYEVICELGHDREKVLPAFIFRIPNFDFNAYAKLLESKISIIAQTCWGGYTYHGLGMKFRSPFINLSIADEDYIKLLKNIKNYMAERMSFLKYEYWESMKREIPIAMLGDVRINLVHYDTYEEGEKKWYQRVKRINWNNLFVMMATFSKEITEEFNMLPFQKKICFVPFESDKPSVHTIYKNGVSDGIMLKQFVNAMADGSYPDYDVIHLLNSGQVNHERLIIR